MADADTVIDDLPALALRIPPVDVSRPHFQLERARHTVRHHQGICFFGLTVLVQVDEPGCDDETACVNGARAVQRVFGHRLDAAVADSDIHDGIETRFRIHHPAALDDDVVVPRTTR